MQPPPPPIALAASLPPRPTAAAAPSAAAPRPPTAPPSPCSAPSDPWPGFQRTIRGVTVRPDATTLPNELAREPKIGWIASPSDTQLFICDVAGCATLFPTAAKLSNHQTTAHAPGVLRSSVTWFDPATEKAAEARDRATEQERMREAARRSFMPL